MRVLAALLCAALLFAAAEPSSPAIPDTPAGRIMTAWFRAFNSGDRDTLLAFMRTYSPDRIKHLDEDLSFHDMTGGFDLRKIVSASPTKIVALVQEHASDQFARMDLELTGTAPYRVKTLGLEAIDRPADFALPHLSQSELVSALTAYAQEQASAERFSGAVLVAHDGAPVFAKAYGFADRAQNTPNTLDTKFRIGSMNKMITAVSIMQLVQAGKIDLNKPFATYLPDYPNKTMASQVTIRELLTHTGGTGDIFGPEFMKNRTKLKTLQDYIDLYGTRPLRFKPGTKWEYSNYGFILLGAIVAKVSGQSYYDYVQEHVYGPAGMRSTGSEPEDVAVPDRSVGYTKMMGGKLQPNTDTLPYRGTSAGGGYSTVGDLVRFANALLNHQLLNAEYTQMLMTGKVKTPMGSSYAFGFDDHTVNGTRCFGHSGGAPGMNGDLEICPSSGYIIAVLSNLDPPAAEHVSDFITNRLPKSVPGI
jgi:CubicO group peptidase (beta-lactamase class C family)